MKSAKAKIQRVPFRRKREGKTNYKKRLRLLMSGKPRLVVRPSNKNLMCQIVAYSPQGDKVLLSAKSNELDKMGWKYGNSNTPAAYLTGFLLGTRAKKKVKDAILDSGLLTLTKGSKIYACVKGAIDAGLPIPFSEEILPSKERINGKHISDYAAKIKGHKELYEKQFSGYLKKNLDPTKITQAFEETKKKISSGENNAS